MSTPTHSEDADDRVPSRRARVVSQVLISSALAITLAAALVGSAEPRPGASFFAEPVAATTEAAAGTPGLDEDAQLDGAIEVLATANALESGDVSPSIEQARSELGMLLATYLAQQDAARRVPVQVVPDTDVQLDDSHEDPLDEDVPLAPDPLDPGVTDELPDEPADPAVPGPDDADVDVPAALTSATLTSTAVDPGGWPTGRPTDAPSGPTSDPTAQPTDGPTGGGGSAGDGSTDDGSIDDGTSGRHLPEDEVPAPDGVAPDELDGGAPQAPGTDDGTADGDDPTAHDGEDGHAHGAVTLDDVVVSATHLAGLLDLSAALPPVGVVPADGVDPKRGTTLAERLAEVVAQYADSTADYENGKIPADVLCDLSFAAGQSLRCDAAVQLEALAAEFEKEFGHPLRITDSYRSYEDQVRLKAIKPYLAAVPGTSQHGWGLAIDVGGSVPSGTSAEYVWMRTHAPDYGWDNPSWARPTGSKPEPWHFEYAAGW